MQHLNITAVSPDPALLDLPWEIPLEQWPDEILAALPRGLSRHMLGALIDHAGRAGLTRLSLETGVQPTFDAARRLYAAAGFRECAPFQGYGPDSNSVFMTLPLS